MKIKEGNLQESSQKISNQQSQQENQIGTIQRNNQNSENTLDRQSQIQDNENQMRFTLSENSINDQGSIMNRTPQNTKRSIKNNDPYKNGIKKKKQNKQILPHINSYEELIQNVYIDKSNFITRFLETNFVILTRPHKWGKSLNMQMLYLFFKGTPSLFYNPELYERQLNIFQGQKVILSQEIDIEKIVKHLQFLDDLSNLKIFELIKIIQDCRLNSWESIAHDVLQLQQNQDYQQLHQQDWRLKTIAREYKKEILSCFELKNEYSNDIQDLQKYIEKYVTNERVQYILEKNKQDYFKIQRTKNTNYDKILRMFGKNTNHMGRYPVIHIKFSKVGDTLELVEKGIISSVQESLKDYYDEFLLFRRKINFKIDEKNLQLYEDNFKQILNFKLENNLCFNVAFQMVCRVLEKMYHRKIIVIMDDYDFYIQQSLYKDYHSQVIEKIDIFINGAIKNNTSIEKAILTGTLPIPSDFFKLCSVYDYDFDKDFGFTFTEIQSLLTNLDFEDDEIKKNFEKKIQTWYNGYQIGYQTLYNPYSIMCLLSSVGKDFNQIKDHFICSMHQKDILKHLKFFKEDDILQLISLSQNDSVYFKPFQFNLLNNLNSYNEYQLLLHYGYLTSNQKFQNTFCIPNYEVKLYFFTHILEYWIKKNTHDSLTSLSRIEDVSYRCNISNFLSKLKKKNLSLSFLQNLLNGGVVIDNNSNFYMHHEFYVSDNFGRQDGLFIPKNKEYDRAFIHEIKLDTEKTSHPQDKLNEGLIQVYSKKKLLAPLSLFEQDKSSFEHLKLIIVRVIALYINLQGYECVAIEYYVHSIQQAWDMVKYDEEELKNLKELKKILQKHSLQIKPYS